MGPEKLEEIAFFLSLKQFLKYICISDILKNHRICIVCKLEGNSEFLYVEELRAT